MKAGLSTCGERWGRHWLDLARYADSTGGGRSSVLSNAWRYRNYVIDAYNQDKPLDLFISEQISGDLMPWSSQEQRNNQLVATAYLAIGPKNLDLQDKELLRMNTVDEQIDTMGRSLLGMTISCARCHDHKFDAISTKGSSRSSIHIEEITIYGYKILTCICDFVNDIFVFPPPSPSPSPTFCGPPCARSSVT